VRVNGRWIGAVALALLYGFALVLVRGEPVLASDQGVYLSVAARILDGDHLYSETIENKDPLFFYTYAAALWIGGWRGPFLLDGAWFALAALGLALLLRELRAPRPAVAAGFFVYPLALSGGWYLAGQTMLGALAVAPFAAWLWLRGRFTASGAALAVVMLLKLNLVAVAAAPIAALVLLGEPAVRRVRAVGHAAAALAGTLGAAALVMALRGELRPYLDLVDYNVYYSSALLESQSFYARVEDHLNVVVTYFDGARWQRPAVVLVLAGFCVAGVYVARAARSTRVRLLAPGAALTLVAAVASLSLTAYWYHHVQVLAYPAALVAATLVSAAAIRLGPRAGVVASAACVGFALWTSLHNGDRLGMSTAWTSSGGSVSSEALEEARMRYFGDAERVTYMAFGGNSENAHAVFISDRFDLACRWFHLYPHSTDDQLEETTECSRREDPMLILVTLGFFDTRAGGSWRAFVSNARRLLDSEYELVVSKYPGFQVWKRTDA
jgi:hypothetical protein